MTKKLVAGIIGVSVLGMVLFGTRFFGYLGTGIDKAKQAARDQVPFEWNLEEAKKKVASLDDVVKKLKLSIAKLETDVEVTNEEIVERQQKADQQLSEMVALSGMVKNADTEYVSVKTKDDTRNYTVSEVKRDLVRRKGSYDRAMKAIEIKHETVNAQQSRLDQLRQKLEDTLALREKMELQIKELEAKKTSLDARKVAEQVEFDDSEISEAQSIIDELQKDLKVQEKMIDMESGSTSGRIPVDVSGEEEADILEQIDAAAKDKNVKPADLKMISVER